MFTRIVRVWILLSLSLLLIACEDQGDFLVVNPRTGGSPSEYGYTGYNSGGTLIIVGTILLAVNDSSSVSGTWSFERVFADDNVGPQLGTGRFAGSIQRASISINLNPGWVDNNVFLFGTIDGGHIRGKWIWDTFVGETAQGTFDAVKKP